MNVAGISAGDHVFVDLDDPDIERYLSSRVLVPDPVADVPVAGELAEPDAVAAATQDLGDGTALEDTGE